MQHLIQDFKQDPNLILVEGFFPCDIADTACVLAQLRYDPAGPEKEKYTVVNSVFRMSKSRYPPSFVNCELMAGFAVFSESMANAVGEVSGGQRSLQ